MSPMLITTSQKNLTPFGKGLSFQLLLTLGQSYLVEKVKTKNVFQFLDSTYILPHHGTLEHCSYATLYVGYEPFERTKLHG